MKFTTTTIFILCTLVKISTFELCNEAQVEMAGLDFLEDDGNWGLRSFLEQFFILTCRFILSGLQIQIV